MREMNVINKVSYFLNTMITPQQKPQMIRIKARKPLQSDYAFIGQHPSKNQVEIIQSINETSSELDLQSSCNSSSSQIEISYSRELSNSAQNLYIQPSASSPKQTTSQSKTKSIKKQKSPAQKQSKINNNKQTHSKNKTATTTFQQNQRLNDAQRILFEFMEMSSATGRLDNNKMKPIDHEALLQASFLITSSSRMGQEICDQLMSFSSLSNYRYEESITNHESTQIKPQKNFSSTNSVGAHTLEVEEEEYDYQQQPATLIEEEDFNQNDQIQISSNFSIPAAQESLCAEHEKLNVKQQLSSLFSIEVNDPKVLMRFQSTAFSAVISSSQNVTSTPCLPESSLRLKSMSNVSAISEKSPLNTTENHQHQQEQVRKQSQASFAASSSSSLPSPSPQKHTKKHSKFHNFNKLFMYSIMNMFQATNLETMRVTDDFAKGILNLITRLKLSAKKNLHEENKHQFDYYSHIHFNVLFLKITEENLPILAQNQEAQQLYLKCFQVDLRDAKITDLSIVYVNMIKTLIFQIFEKCINEKNIKELNEQKQDERRTYTLKVISGIRKLAAGIVIKRF